MMMRPYILFLDTEASGKPTKWTEEPPSMEDWPYLVQLSWVICTQYGSEVKRENKYVNNTDFESSREAFKIHGIDEAFRSTHGQLRREVLMDLLQDIRLFDPLIVCHFKNFDIQLLQFELQRAGIRYDLLAAPTFCTREATRDMVGAKERPNLQLSELYALLFYKKLDQHHDALSDAVATSLCFFELLAQGIINEKSINQQIEESKIIW